VSEPIPSDIDALRAALAAEQLARREAEARASGAEAMVAHLKLVIARLKHDRFGASSERGRKLLDQLELQLEELEATASEDAAPEPAKDETIVRPFTRRKPVRAPLPEHLPRVARDHFQCFGDTGTCRSEPAGDDPGREVRPASAVEPAERSLRP
jgi:transposase